ncbi:MAG: hypothetical protein OXC31_10335 [Spirochaetaceae bacterium]|nr:hypothetical protein [Spirochaetaceae bacterium]
MSPDQHHTDLAALKARIDDLSPMATRFVARLIGSLSSPPQATVNPQRTWITESPDWVEYFSLALSVHHGTTTEPLGLTGFEIVFCNACEAVEWKYEKPESATHRFVDLVVRRDTETERKLSLKSTAAKRLSDTTVHISKLTEAAWIQDMRRARDRQERMVGLFRDYMEAVDAIMMLRAFRKPNEIPERYQLVEIPTPIFRSIQAAPLSAFAADGPTVDCSYGGLETAARVSLDRSDANVTVKQIALEACTVHAEWHLAE